MVRKNWVHTVIASFLALSTFFMGFASMSPAQAAVSTGVGAAYGGASGTASASTPFKAGVPTATSHDNPTAAMKWFYEQRFGKNGKVNAIARMNALQQKALLPTYKPSNSIGFAVNSTTYNWTNLGPNPTHGLKYPPNYKVLSDSSGRIDSVAVAPNGTIFIGTAGGGVWKSTNNGQSWTPLSDNQPSLAIGAIAIDPSNQQVIYAGTGEQNFGGDSFYGSGILKSTDGGTTWSVLGANIFDQDYISSIVIDPDHTNTIFVASSYGVYKSLDGGLTWVNITPETLYPRVTSLIQIPHTATLFAASESGIFTSNDNGSSWTLLDNTNGLPTAITDYSTAKLTYAPSSPNVLYASISSYSNNQLLGLYVSQDSGKSWVRLATPDYLSDSYYYGGTTPGGQGYWDNTIIVDPNNANKITAGGIDLVQSTDGGLNWTELSKPNNMHPDNHALAYNPVNGDLIVGNDGGVWSVDASGTATNLNTNLSITQFYNGISEYNNGSIILAGAQDNGTVAYDKTSGKWNEIDGGDGAATLINPNDSNNIYTEVAGVGIDYFVGGIWHGFAPVNGMNWVAPLAFDPVDTHKVYVAGYDLSMIDTTNTSSPSTSTLVDTTTLFNNINANNITAGYTTQYSVTGNISAMTIAHDNSRNLNIYYATWPVKETDISNNTVKNGHLTLISKDGNYWTPLDWEDNYVTDLKTAPGNPYDLYITTSGYSSSTSNTSLHLYSPPHVYESVNTDYRLGLNKNVVWGFNDLTGNLPDAPVNAIEFNGSQLIVASDVGVFTSLDHGTTWSSIGNALPNVEVVGLKLTANGTLLAATHGRGIWSIPVGSAPVEPTSVTGITPNKGTINSMHSVKITGTGFTNTNLILLIPTQTNGWPSLVSNYTVVSDNEIDATLPSLPLGAYDIQVTAAGGPSALTAADQFHSENSSISLVPGNTSLYVNTTTSVTGVVYDVYGNPAQNIPVNLSVSGPGFIGNSASTTVTQMVYTVTTDVYGQYSGLFQAGSTAGQATVTADVYTPSVSQLHLTASQVIQVNAISTGGSLGGSPGGSIPPIVTPPTNNQGPNVIISKDVDTKNKDVTIEDKDKTIQITLAKGSLPSGTHITITKVDKDKAKTHNVHLLISSDILKIDTDNEPTKPAKIVLHYNLSDGVTPDDLGVYTFVDGKWKFFGQGQIDKVNHTITILLPHFSEWGVLANTVKFSDVATNHWASAAIRDLTVRGIVNGYADGIFKPSASITRAEFIKMLMSALNIKSDSTTQQTFSDISSDKWYAGYINSAYAKGIFKGYEGMARADDQITRQEATVLIMRAVQYAKLHPVLGANPLTTKFKDEKSFSVWAVKQINDAVNYGLIHGYLDGTFKPDKTISRAEGVTLIENLVKLQQAQNILPM